MDNPEILAWLHCGDLCGDEQDQWEIEVESSARCDAYTAARPGQHVALYPAEVVERLRDENERLKGKPVLATEWEKQCAAIERLWAENEALREAGSKVECPHCGGHHIVQSLADEMRLRAEVEALQDENQRMRSMPTASEAIRAVVYGTEINRLRAALVKVRAHTSHNKLAPDELHIGLLASIERIVDDALAAGRE